MRLVLQPCGNADSRKHYLDTIENRVVFADYETLLQPIMSQLLEKFPSGKAAVWGVTEGKLGQNRKKWERIEIGDVSVFSRDGGIFATGIVALKFHSKELAELLWGVDPEGNTWEHIYFLDEIREFVIPYSEFNETVGYKDNFVIQGFQVLDDAKSEMFVNKYDHLSKRYFPSVTNQEYLNALESLAAKETLSKEVTSIARVEQSFLRSLLFQKPSSKCAMCGEEYPIEFLVAAHIKKRSACTDKEKLDGKNLVMAACTFGCDEMFERGYVTVDGSGAIIISKNRPHSASSQRYANSLQGKHCAAHSEGSEVYFDWHRTHIFIK